MAAKKILKWVDDRSVLRLDGKIYKAGDSLPAGSFQKGRVKLFKELGLIESLATEAINEDSPGE